MADIQAFERFHRVYLGVTAWYAKSQSIWKAVIILASILYLLGEMIFNARLVDIAGGVTIDPSQFQAIEVFGRGLSAFGISLLLISFLTYRSGIEIALPRALLIMAFIWPAAYWGQKFAIDYYLIDPSTPAQRQEAYGARLARLAMSNGALEIEGISYGQGDPDSAGEKTFHTLFGSLVYVDSKLLDSIRAREDDLAREYIRQTAYKDFDKQYALYSQARDAVRDGYAKYQKAQAGYRDQHQALGKEVDRQSRNLDSRIEGYWDTYYAGVRQFDAKTLSQAQGIAPKLYNYFERVNSKNCSTYCVKQLHAKYREEVGKLGYGFIEPNTWLIKTEKSTGTKASNVVASLAAGVLTGGLSLVYQGIGALTGGKDDQDDGYVYSYTADVKHYQRILQNLPANIAAFEKRSGGIPYGIENAYLFRQSPEVLSSIRSDLQRQGIRVPNDWVPEQKNTFGRALGKKLEADLRAAWIKQHGLSPGLNWSEFQQHHSVQSQFKRALDRWYRSPVLADWNDAEFKQFILDPAVASGGQEFLAEIKASESAFADGARYERKGKDALRAIVIPPIAMAISLLLSIITAVRLGLMALFHCIEMPLWSRVLIRTLAIPAVLIIPLGIGMIAQHADNTGIGYFVDVMRDEAHPVTGAALIWTLTLQPVIHPIGDVVASAIPVFEIFHDRIDGLPSGFVH